MFEESATDALQQVRLAEAAAAMDEQRGADFEVVLVLGQALGGGIGELITRANDEIIEAMAEAWRACGGGAAGLFRVDPAEAALEGDVTVVR